MKSYFFEYIDNIPGEFHSNLVSVGHILVISIIISFWIIMLRLFKYKKEEKKWRLLLIASLSLPLLEAAQTLWYIYVRQFSLGYALPLHLCSLMCIILPLMVITRNKLLMEYSYAIGLAPSFITMLTPDVYYYPSFSFIYLQTMLAHGIICFIPVFLICCMGFRPHIRNLPKSVAMMIGLAIIMIPVNYITEGNYFYLRYPAAGSIMEYFAKSAGSPGYLVPVFLLGCILWLLMYLPFILTGHKKKHSKRLVKEDEIKQLVIHN
ncbi:putative integral membrane protein (TIGR02206 family) [Ruminiclostridium sufflavum DSM 19573]|uniref:Putative integral membrane protein (TIGR02206 family) n=1 Tax=Ruminiclostridium sufflavum DSM 19573 TaxID=1121337 RepID=A0A318XJA9_9FIRM|nr:TIGR02206 family membrane protein [Ruminiclostridium sufflavum]PYG86616.1 putative integral membrane protein (TIGR02206 family) [Ruminiclostridium sufflavum DSM 19573]